MEPTIDWDDVVSASIVRAVDAHGRFTTDAVDAVEGDIDVTLSNGDRITYSFGRATGIHGANLATCR
jgi:hypothetical protein